jgi:hypothetical protein
MILLRAKVSICKPVKIEIKLSSLKIQWWDGHTVPIRFSCLKEGRIGGKGSHQFEQL